MGNCTSEQNDFRKIRVGNWLPSDPQEMIPYLSALKSSALQNKKRGVPLIPSIKDFKNLVEEDPVLNNSVSLMFAEVRGQKTPLQTKGPQDFDEFLHMLNVILTTAPAFYTEGASDDPAGLIAFPINAILDFPMATKYGYAVFSTSLVNRQLKKILSEWSKFLTSEDSRYVLATGKHDVLHAPVIPWLSEASKKQIVEVAFQWRGKLGVPEGTQFQDVFISDPSDPVFFGFRSWDNFFTRNFVDGVRPIGGPNPQWHDDNKVVISACESAPFRVKVGAKLDDRFWLKKQPYSVRNILNFDKRVEEFDGGTVYQAFLSALSYHRWNSPVSGKIVKTEIVNGTYYLENINEGFLSPSGKPDLEAPNSSQPFLTAVATRALIFIEADGPIGLMCFCAVGMSEVSSCEITVKPGQHIKKGHEIGMFHYGGSTHCLLFRKNINLEFVDFTKVYNTGEPSLQSTNVPVKAQIARYVNTV